MFFFTPLIESLTTALLPVEDSVNVFKIELMISVEHTIKFLTFYSVYNAGDETLRIYSSLIVYMYKIPVKKNVLSVFFAGPTCARSKSCFRAAASSRCTGNVTCSRRTIANCSYELAARTRWVKAPEPNFKGFFHFSFFVFCFFPCRILKYGCCEGFKSTPGRPGCAVGKCSGRRTR